VGDSEGPTERDLAGSGRDVAAKQRDRAAEERDRAGEQRDLQAATRDEAWLERDHISDARDHAALERDKTAQQRDLAEAGHVTGIAAEALVRSSLARRHAASDRRQSAKDRQAGADLRVQAERDRDAGTSERVEAEHDRDAAASERTEAAYDRNLAQAARSARTAHPSIDDASGAYIRSAGFMELDRDVARARRTGEPLTLVAVEVDRPKTARSDGEDDEVLAEIASALTGNLRPYDLVIRSGGDEFVCAISGLDEVGTKERFARVNSALEHGSVATRVAELQAGDSTEELMARAGAARL
jgi:diguanylate cyclase (GGDEF)-like protein